LKKLLLASENSEIPKKIFQKFRKFGSTDFDARSIVFFKKQKFPLKFTRGRKIEGARS
jgi:hypothetical protein